MLVRDYTGIKQIEIKWKKTKKAFCDYAMFMDAILLYIYMKVDFIAKIVGKVPKKCRYYTKKDS